ncbi:MAG TPA: helix-turn-helix domain-containing protein [Flavisolibacter sp.]|nr:helix-turn-helix domain-containing protein [Flavisolibacter sp.]
MKKKIITSKKDYNEVMRSLENIVNKGEKNLSSRELKQIKDLALAAQEYEQKSYHIPAPETLEGIIELKMFEHKLKQKDLAKLLGIGEAKLSQILSKKRRPDVLFLKAAHEKLGIDGNMLLQLI